MSVAVTGSSLRLECGGAMSRAFCTRISGYGHMLLVMTCQVEMMIAHYHYMIPQWSGNGKS